MSAEINPTLPPNSFQCSSCGEIFEKAWTDEEALAELQENFPDNDPNECDLICEDCFQKFFGGLVNA
jgi:hypothetical protein